MTSAQRNVTVDRTDNSEGSIPGMIRGTVSKAIAKRSSLFNKQLFRPPWLITSHINTSHVCVSQLAGGACVYDLLIQGP